MIAAKLLASLVMGAAQIHAATLSVLSPPDAAPNEAAVSTVTVDVGAGVLGGTDFRVVFDSGVARLDAIRAQSPEFSDNLFFNPGRGADGELRVVTYNGASTQSPSGLVGLLNIDFTAAGAPGSSTTLQADAFALVDAQAASFLTVEARSGALRIAVDRLPPRTSLVVSGPRLDQEPPLVSSSAVFNLQSLDDRYFPGDLQGVGIAETRIAVDTATFSLFPGTFSFTADGIHAIQWFSVDLIGNVEVVKSSSAAVDATPPRTRLEVAGSSAVVGGTLFVAGSSTVTLNASDPVVAGVASGLARTSVSTGSAAFVALSSRTTLELAEGAHLLVWSSEDRIGNVEAEVSALVAVDAAAPSTRLLINGLAAAATQVRAVSTDAFSCASTDSASGVGQVRFTIDDGGERVFGDPFTLAVGTHTLSFAGVDNVGNVEAAHAIFIDVSAADAAPPSLALAPVDGSTVTDARPLVRAAYSDPSGVDLGSFRLFLDGAEATALAAVGASSASFRPSADLAQGTHVTFARISDLEGHVAESTATFFIDSISPVTALLIGEPRFGEDPVFVSTLTMLGFEVSEPAQTFFAMDPSTGLLTQGLNAATTGQFTVFSTAFGLAEGRRLVAYGSFDRAGNFEVLNSGAVLVDGTAPEAFLEVLGSSTVVEGELQITAGSSVSLVAVDPIVNGVASGVGFIGYLVDVSPEACGEIGEPVPSEPPGTCRNPAYLGPFVLSLGTHTVFFVAQDHVRNGGDRVFSRSLRVTGDVVAPQTSLIVGEPKFQAELLFVSTRTQLGFSVSEPARTFYAVDATSFTLFTASFTLTREGLNAIAYFSADPAGNTEPTRVSTVAVDATAPASALFVNGLVQPATQFVVVSTDVFSLVSTDTVSGLFTVRFAIDGGAEQNFSAGFSLDPGPHTISYFALDNVGNLEQKRTAAIAVSAPDTEAPSLTLSPLHGSTVTTSTPAIVASYSDAGSGIAISTVKLILDGTDVTVQSTVTVSSATFTPTSPLVQGSHVVSAEVTDLAGNRAAAQAAWLLDSLAPVTTLLVNGIPTVGATLTASTTDVFSFSAADAGTGVQQTLFSLDGGAEQVFSAPFTLATGERTLSFRSRDRAGNLEAAKTTAISVRAVGFTVALDLKPETLNLRSQGEFVSAHIEIAGAESATHIVTGTVRVSQIDGRAISPPIFIDPKGPVTLEDADFDGIAELKVKFPREQMNAVLPGDREVKVTVAGTLRSGATFEGTDAIRTLGKGFAPATGDDDSGFSLLAAYAFPNPAKGSNPTIRLQTRGTADFVQITIYNVFKEVIHTASPGAPQRIDGKWTCDYTWSVSGARTGMYIYRIQARKVGFPEINAVGRVAVIR